MKNKEVEKMGFFNDFFFWEEVAVRVVLNRAHMRWSIIYCSVIIIWWEGKDGRLGREEERRWEWEMCYYVEYIALLLFTRLKPMSRESSRWS